MKIWKNDEGDEEDEEDEEDKEDKDDKDDKDYKDDKEEKEEEEEFCFAKILCLRKRGGMDWLEWTSSAFVFELASCQIWSPYIIEADGIGALQRLISCNRNQLPPE